MKKFRFSLERVMHWQSKCCQVEEEELRMRRGAVARTETQICDLKARRSATERDALSRPVVSSTELAALGSYRLSAVKQERSLEQQRNAQVQAVTEQTTRVSDERRRLRMMEKLRDKSLQEYTIAFERELAGIALDSHLAQWITRSRMVPVRPSETNGVLKV